MWKKLSRVMLVLTIVFSFGVGFVDVADAATKSYRAPKKSFDSNATPNQSTPNQSTTPNQSSGVNKADPGTAAKTSAPSPAANGITATKPGFFSGGLMKGLLIGGFASMLFGGLFGNMGMLGNILGLLVNVVVVMALVGVVMKIVQHFRKRKFD